MMGWCGHDKAMQRPDRASRIGIRGIGILDMRSRWITHSLAVIGVTVVLTSCEGIKKQIGLAKYAPDEFTVVTKAPLIIPPDFTLRPPRPGAAGPQEIQVQEQARRALLRSGRVQSDTSTITSTAAPPSRSRAETVFLRNAGADKADPEIRTVIRRETLALAEKDSSFTRRLMFWRCLLYTSPSPRD